MGKGSFVSWQQAEDALSAAFEYLGRMPDRDRAFRSAGSRSCWPEIIRSVRDGDYGDGQGHADAVAPSARLTRRCVDLVNRMLLDADHAAQVIPEGHRRLVGRVLWFKRVDAGEFSWSAVWQAEGRSIIDLRSSQSRPATTDAMRMAYERAIGRLALRLDTMVGKGEFSHLALIEA